MANKIQFRDAALKHYTSPEQLDQMIQVVTPQSWLITGTLYALLFILFIWSLIGTIPTRAEGPGILLTGGGDIYTAVAPDGPSHLRSIEVKPGDHVVKGQVIATLARPDLTDEIKVTQNYLSELQNKRDQLLEVSTQKINKRKQEIDDQKKSLRLVLIASKEKFKHLENFLALRQAAFKKGIETRQNLEQTFQDYYNVKSEIEGYTNRLIQLDIDQANFIDDWHQQLREIDLKITDEKLKLSNLQTRLKLSSKVTSPAAGIITNIQASLGSIINTSAPIASIVSEGSGLDAVVFLPPHMGKRVKPGMQALVYPTTSAKEEYGGIKGNVISVSTFPSTTETMQTILQNSELVKKFSQDEVPIEARIRMINDPTTFSGLKWSSSNGPKQQITPGTLVTAMITVREQKPITLIIPALKKLAGVKS